MKEVAAQLRNTPAVCRKSYINPVVFAGWRSGVLHEVVRAEAAKSASERERAGARLPAANGASRQVAVPDALGNKAPKSTLPRRPLRPHTRVHAAAPMRGSAD